MSGESLFVEIHQPALSNRRKRLLLRKLGFRTLMDVIPLDASLVRGSHGRLTAKAEDGPLVITDQPQLLKRDHIAATDVKQLLLNAVFQ